MTSSSVTTIAVDATFAQLTDYDSNRYLGELVLDHGFVNSVKAQRNEHEADDHLHLHTVVSNSLCTNKVTYMEKR